MPTFSQLDALRREVDELKRQLALVPYEQIDFDKWVAGVAAEAAREERRKCAEAICDACRGQAAEGIDQTAVFDFGAAGWKWRHYWRGNLPAGCTLCSAAAIWDRDRAESEAEANNAK